jgi:arginyl-tRNA synthetase
VTYDPLGDFDREILRFLHSAGVESEIVQLSTPPDREFGERATNAAFRLARERRQSPQQIAQAVAAQFRPDGFRFINRVEPAGNGYINFHLNYETFVPHVMQSIRDAGELYGRRPNVESVRAVVEHTSVNPNKEWHIGHVRNAVLGDVLSRLLHLAGHDVEVQNYVDDTGLQAAQAVLGFQDFPEVRRPGEKFDDYVGRSYVKIAAELGAERALRARFEELQATPPEAGDRQAMQQESERINARLENIDRLQKKVMGVMRDLEEGEHYPLLEQILNAQLETAVRLGVAYDLLIWESHLVRSNVFREAIRRLEESPHVYWAQGGRYHGALVIETGPGPEEGEPKCEVLIRSSGIPTYVAKDIAYHLWKFGLLADPLRYVLYSGPPQPQGHVLWSTALQGEERPHHTPDKVINVIAVNQSQAQDAVKDGLRAAGFEEAADHLIHLGYGLVSTAEGRISGRKGTAVAGDTVIDEAVRVALERVKEKRSQELTDAEMERIAEAVGIGALRYFMVQYNPLRDIVFNVADVVSYDGNTGLYVQYALVRMSAILRKAVTEHGVQPETIDNADASLLQHEQEKRLAFHLALYPSVVADASRTLALNLVAEFAFDLATIFSQFYRDCPVLNAESVALRDARLLLVRTVRDALANACNVLGIPVIERL